MTDNPTPNEIALLREAAQALVDRFPKDWPDYSPCYDEVTALRAALAPGQHDGAADVPWKSKGPTYRSQCQCICHRNEPGIAIAHFAPCCLPDPAPRNSEGATDNGLPPLSGEEIADAVAKWCSSPKPSTEPRPSLIAPDPNLKAAPLDVLGVRKPSTEQARAEGYVLVPVKPSMAMLNAAIDTDSRKLGDISPLGFRCSPQMMFERCWAAMLDAAATPSGADALGDRL